MTKGLLFLAARIFLIGLSVLVSCADEDKGSLSAPVDPEEHLFYIGAFKGGLVKVFSVEQRKFVDSLICSNIPDTEKTTLNVIGDDSLLVISYNRGTYLVDLKTKEVVDTLNYSNMIVSPNSQYFVAGNISSGNKRELHKFDGLEYITDIPGKFEKFGNNSKCISYMNIYSDSSTISLYNVEADTTITKRKFSNSCEIWSIYTYPVKKSEKVFFGGGTSIYECPYHSYALVSNFDSNTVRILKEFPLDTYIEPNTALPIISPDNKYLYFSVLISTIWGGYPDRTIYVYDIESEDSVKTITLPQSFVPSAYSMSYDGIYLITKDYEYSSGDINIGFCLIDVINGEVIGTYEYGGQMYNMAAKHNIKIGLIKNEVL
jgi:hypothetical protein